MKRVLLTGATGFVGVNLAERLLQEGHEVHMFLREGYQTWRIEHLRAHSHKHKINLLDKDSVETKLQQIRPDWIFHLAAYGAYSWQDNSTQAVQTNYLGTVNLIEACLQTGFEVLINTGSSSEYGVKDHAPPEDEYLEPNSYYAVTKAAATLFCRFSAQRHNSPIFTLRLYSVYGPFEEPQRFIPQLVVQGLHGEFPPLADPEIARDFIFTEDVVRAYLLLAESAATLQPGEVYNVGTGEQLTIRDATNIAKEVLNIHREPVWNSLPNRSWDSTTWVANNAKLRGIGWSPQYDFRAGFIKTVAWFQQSLAPLNRIYRSDRQRSS